MRDICQPQADDWRIAVGYKMDEKMSHDQYVDSVRAKIVEAAQAMLDGSLSYLLGARRMDALRHEVAVKSDDEDFMVSVSNTAAGRRCPVIPLPCHWRASSSSGCPRQGLFSRHLEHRHFRAAVLIDDQRTTSDAAAVDAGRRLVAKGLVRPLSVVERE